MWKGGSLLHIENEKQKRNFISVCYIIENFLYTCIPYRKIIVFEQVAISRKIYRSNLYINTWNSSQAGSVWSKLVAEILYLYFFHSNFYFYWKNFLYSSRYISIILEYFCIFLKSITIIKLVWNEQWFNFIVE